MVPAGADLSSARVLVIAIENWELGARFAVERRAGFSVAASCPSSHILRAADIAQRYFCLGYARFGSLVSALRAWRPRLLVCADDRARYTARRLSKHLSQSIGRRLWSGRTIDAVARRDQLTAMASEGP